jgi:formate dehydrogenase subunit gamma
MQESLLFDQFWPWVFAMPFLGFLAAGLSRRTDPVIKGNKVLRHDLPARIAHWSHALSTVVLLVSGIMLGSRFSPSLLPADNTVTAVWLNAHFVAVLIFLFGTFYWIGNTIVSPHRLREHLPHKNFLSSILNHYGSLLKIKGCVMPKEEKYFESERVAFIAALAAAAGVGLSGVVKVLAHVVFLPPLLMNIVTWTHDLAAALMLLFLAAHIFFGAILPIAWKAFPSMLTGYLSLEAADEEYPVWVEQISAAADQSIALKTEDGRAGEQQQHEKDNAASRQVALERKDG